MQPASRQRIGKHVPAATNTHVGKGAFYSVRAKELKGRQLGSNTSIVALRVVGGDEKGTQCLGLHPGHSVPRGYKYGDLVLWVEGVSNLRQ
jgi:hypothetical protein